jgi:hypothetical protein
MEKLPRFPFSLPAFLLAPWLAPVLCSVLLMLNMGSKRPVAFFLITLGVGLVVSYLGTAVLIVCLWCIASVRAVTKIITALTGTVVATMGYVPFIFVNWHASGPDSGPPVGSFASYLLRSLHEPFLYISAGAGLVTALLYDFLARRSGKSGNTKSKELQ